MITTFEDDTPPLNDYEMNVLLPVMVNGFKKKVGVEKCITNPKICKILKEKGYKVSEPRVRKLVFYIRQNNLVPKLIASSKGYWIATNRDEITGWVTSLENRISAMEETKKYAETMLNNWDKPNDNMNNQNKLF